MGWILSALLLLVAALPAWAQSSNTRAAMNDASLTATTNAANVNFAGKPVNVYLEFCNEGSVNVGVNPTGTASIGTAGTHTILPNVCIWFDGNLTPQNTWSVISASSTAVVTVWFR